MMKENEGNDKDLMDEKRRGNRGRIQRSGGKQEACER